MYKDHVSTGKILIIGHGLGFEYDLIEKFNKNLVSIDTYISKSALHKDKVQLYSGDIIPFKDDTFDAVICNYVLHHSNNPKQLFSELVRVSKNIVIITEETHKNVIQKIRSVFNCWNLNRKAGQFVRIRWSSYLSMQDLQKLIRNLTILKHIKEDRGVHIYEFLILKKD